MNKILSFIVNEYDEFLLLKGNPNDPQLKKSFWYVVTGKCEREDKTKKDTVIREIKEETGLDSIEKIMYLNWIFKYNSLSQECTEYAYLTFVKKTNILLNEENIDFKWCKLSDFIDKVHWFYDKEELTKVLEYALNNKLFFEGEKIEIFQNIEIEDNKKD